MWGMFKERHLKIVAKCCILYQEAELYFKEDELKKLADPSDCVNLVYNHIYKLTTFKDIIADTQDRKSNITSDIIRIEGNDYFLRDNYLNALEKYTKSIASAENGSSYLALAYANRSACLFKGKYYKECLQDINRALSLDYPEKLKPKLLKRKMDAESQKHMQKQVRFYSKPPVIRSKNPFISCAEDSIEIQYNKKYGRHIIATRDINIGEVLSVENSFCHVVCADSKYIHCHECLELCFNMIPCENCTRALYCSEDCRSNAFKGYHKYECQFPKILFLDPKMMMFIKLTLIGMDDSKKTEAESPDNIHRSDSFKEIIKLETHDKECDSLKLFMVATMASIAYHVLKENQEFVSKYDTDEDDLNLKKLLFKTLLISSINPFLIQNFFNINSKELGNALYAFTSLYNHSCVANAQYFHHGSSIVTRVTASIKKGEQITISYGLTFDNQSRAYRQKILKELYLFECDCKACTNNWPTGDNLPFGKEIPLSFILNLEPSQEYNEELDQFILNKCKRLYYQLKNYEPCQNLLILQYNIAQVYRHEACSEVKF
ncbi:unnamed protein product [Psylliodes chrysocephalus]|uniref:SET and MYND domain-containing protein 4 n=1 Tax=Psylliodes chrysocephalus TaxID=3402493 RepID=A0A9P0CNR2_9CUCU|nr:unnamed protein product [Psylliodes chrysocephala]